MNTEIPNDEMLVCSHCRATCHMDEGELSRYGLCSDCDGERAREFWADIAFEDARCGF